MKKIKIFFDSLKKIFSQKTWVTLKIVPRTLRLGDKIVLAGFAFLILISGFFIWQNHWLKTTQEVPASGGILTEGIVGEAKDLDKHIARLTGAGLTRLAENSDVKGDLAESWQILDDGKTYQFKIRAGYSASDLLAQIKNKNVWGSIDMSAPDEQTLVFKFKSPFSPFLYVSTEPIFSYGPYQISKEEKNKVTLLANKDYWQGSPNISTIEINLFSDQNTLSKAAKNGEIMSYMKENKDDYQIDDATTFSYTLPRELNLFFNLSKPELTHKDWRQNLRDNKPLPQEMNWTLATSDTAKNIQIAEGIKQKWQGLKVNLTIKTYNNIELQKDIIPARNYDLLLYGQDYGPDPDPYPFWHSSQIGTGSNLSNYSNKKADKLLEDARQTFDFTVRDQKYKEFRDILADDVPYINIEKDSVDYVISNKVKGITKIFGFSEADRFLDINQWYIKSKRVKN